MSHDEIRSQALETLAEIIPEADVNSLRTNISIREQLDIDSMNFPNFVIAIHNKLNVDVPECDYPKLVTIDGCTDYLAHAFAH